MTFSDFQKLYSKRPRYRAMPARVGLPDYGLTRRSQNNIRLKTINEENAIYAAAERTLIKEYARIRKRGRKFGQTPLETQAEMIRLKLIPDVRVETLKKKRRAGK